jgi:hypothetical protein
MELPLRRRDRRTVQGDSMFALIRKWERCLTIGSAAIALAGSIIGMVWAASGDRATVLERQERTTHSIDDHEQRLRTIETSLPAMAENVRLTREAVSRIEERVNR